MRVLIVDKKIIEIGKETMRKLTQEAKEQIATDPYYKKCCRSSEGTCQGRITIEHAIIYAGRQLDALWSLLPLCAYHHEVDQFQDKGDLQKEKNIWIALCRASDQELQSISKAVNYIHLREFLNKKYG